MTPARQALKGCAFRSVARREYCKVCRRYLRAVYLAPGWAPAVATCLKCGSIYGEDGRFQLTPLPDHVRPVIKSAARCWAKHRGRTKGAPA